MIIIEVKMFHTLVSHLHQLDLDIGSSLDDVRQAFRTLSFIWHPDRQPATYTDLAKSKIQRINAAYEWINKNPDVLQEAPKELAPEPSPSAEAQAYKAKTSKCIRCHGSGLVAVEVNWKGEFEHETCEICDGRGKIVVDHRNQCKDCAGEGLNLNIDPKERSQWIETQMANLGWFDRNMNPNEYKRHWLQFHRERGICSSCKGSGFFYHRPDIRRNERRVDSAADFLHVLQKKPEFRRQDRRLEVCES
jgi:hypothetical protein